MTSHSIRREDARLLTGRGQYTADHNLPGQLHAVVMRSDRAHARILGIDTAAAAAMPGVHLVITSKDFDAAGWKSMPGGVAFKGKDGQEMKKPHWPALARGKVQFVGQPVALVVADTPALAQDAAEAIVVDYEDLPAVIGFAAATAPGAPQLHDNVPGNLAFDYESGDAAAVDAAFARAKHVSRVTFESQRVSGAPMELRAFIAEWKDGVLNAYTPSQGMTGMRTQAAQVTGLPEEKIRIITTDVGGSFGLRSHLYVEHAAVMLAAKLLNRPVKWVAQRSELFLAENHGRALSLSGELALDAEGNFLAMRWNHQSDIGAFASMFGAFVGSRNITITMGGVYRVPALYGRARVAYTNTAQVSSYRGAGRPDIACAIEMLVSKAAAEHGFDPIALRRRNFVPPSAMPYKTANGLTYDCGEFEAVMDKALPLADWAGSAARRARSEKAGKLRGIGIATFLELSAVGNFPKDEVSAKFDRNGNMAIYAVSQSNGQGHETTFTNIIAGALGVDAARITLHEGDPDMAMIGNGTGGSRSLYGAGSALLVLAPKVIETARPLAAALLDAPAAQTEWRDGAFEAAGRRIGLFELAAQLAPAQGAHPMDCAAEGSSGGTFPNGCHIAEVEIDPETGITDITSYVTVDDAGNVIDHASVEGQVHGGVMQGIGQVLGEHLQYDAETGQLLTASFLDYVMPRADWMHSIRCDDHPVPTKGNLLGAKGVGESGTSGSLPALMNALTDALRSAGVAQLDMPLTPDRLWRALAAVRRKAA